VLTYEKRSPSGGRDVVHQFLKAGVVDELSLALAPVFVGDGLRLFDAHRG